MKPQVSIVILVYNSMDYIGKCLESVFSQTYSDFEVIIVINGTEDGSEDFIRSFYGDKKNLTLIKPADNAWYARGNNIGIARARGDFVLALNHDTIMEPDFLGKTVAAIKSDTRLGSVTGKLLHYIYDIDSKTRILDSTGIEIFKTRKVIDRGQWEEDRGQYDRDTAVFGASGAAALYRRSALEQVKVPKRGGGFEYFDEDFTAYKEDVDLSWRLQLAGYSCRYIPEAVVYHGRSVGRSWPTQFIRFILNRRRQSRLIRKLSFRNHYLMMVKNELPAVLWRHSGYILMREVLLFLYSLIFEQFQILAVRDFFRLLPEARRKRKYIMSRVKKVSPRAIINLFHKEY